VKTPAALPLEKKSVAPAIRSVSLRFDFNKASRAIKYNRGFVLKLARSGQFVIVTIMQLTLAATEQLEKSAMSRIRGVRNCEC
jgi:hypothetical protein